MVTKLLQQKWEKGPAITNLFLSLVEFTRSVSLQGWSLKEIPSNRDRPKPVPDLIAGLWLIRSRLLNYKDAQNGVQIMKVHQTSLLRFENRSPEMNKYWGYQSWICDPFSWDIPSEHSGGFSSLKTSADRTNFNILTEQTSSIVLWQKSNTLPISACQGKICPSRTSSC